MSKKNESSGELPNLLDDFEKASYLMNYLNEFSELCEKRYRNRKRVVATEDVSKAEKAVEDAYCMLKGMDSKLADDLRGSAQDLWAKIKQLSEKQGEVSCSDLKKAAKLFVDELNSQWARIVLAKDHRQFHHLKDLKNEIKQIGLLIGEILE